MKKLYVYILFLSLTIFLFSLSLPSCNPITTIDPITVPLKFIITNYSTNEIKVIVYGVCFDYRIPSVRDIKTLEGWKEMEFTLGLSDGVETQVRVSFFDEADKDCPEWVRGKIFGIVRGEKTNYLVGLPQSSIATMEMFSPVTQNALIYGFCYYHDSIYDNMRMQTISELIGITQEWIASYMIKILIYDSNIVLGVRISSKEGETNLSFE